MHEKYLVYELNAETISISLASIFAKLFIAGLMIFGYVTPLVGIILLVMTTVIAMFGYRPHREKYTSHNISFDK